MRNCDRLPVEIRRWIISHSRKNFWRVAGFYDLDDLIQDGLMIACKCRQKYGTNLDPPHFMQLVKVSFYNHIGGVLRQKRGVYEHSKNIPDLAYANNEAGLTDIDILDRILPGVKPIAETVVYLGEMPENIRKALSFFCSEDGIKELFRSRVRLDDGSRSDDTFMSRLRRLAGLPENCDLEAELMAYFAPY